MLLLPEIVAVAMSAAAILGPPFFPTPTPISPSSPPLLPSKHHVSNFRLKPIHCITPTPSTSSDPTFLFHQLGLNHKQIHFLFQTHPQLLQFTSPESLRRRIASLHSVSIIGLALHRAITRRPDILTSPEIDPFLDFVREQLAGLRPEKLERLLVSTHPQLFPGFTARVQLLRDHGIPEEKLAHVLNNVNVSKVFCEMPLRELEDTVLFLQRFAWPDLLLRRPVILNLDLNSQLIPRVEFLTELGGGDGEAAAFLIGKLPAILAYTVEHCRSHLDFWRSVGLTREQVFRIALVYPNVFSVSRERKLQPRIEFLMQCEFSAEDIFKFLIKAPLFLSLSFQDNLSKKLCFLVKIGYRHRTRELVLAVGAATRTSCKNMQMVIELFFSYGFSCEDVLIMSKIHPQILQYNHQSLEKKMEFLIEGMGRDIGELMAFPAFLGYNLDDRIKRRYEVKKEIRGKGMSLNKLLSVSTERFNSNASRSSVAATTDAVPIETQDDT